MALFDAYLMVDWSASNSPKLGKDSIWSAAAETSPDRALTEPTLGNWPTRDACIRQLRDRLLNWMGSGKQVLVGFDFPFGYPAGSANALWGQSSDPAWLRTWNHLRSRISDSPSNQTNRFDVASDMNKSVGPGPGPFWGCPSTRQTANLSFLKARLPTLGGAADLREFRQAETALLMRGLHPRSVWQLYGNGSVGSQALTGIPRLVELLTDDSLRPNVQVWPFQTGFATPPLKDVGSGRVLLCEIWPGAVRVDLGAHPIRDAAQMISVVRCIAAADRKGTLGGMLSGSGVPASLRAECIEEEGWILGVAAA
jgi:precorrin-8X/cobalt-precorrin-8 methylmutase